MAQPIKITLEPLTEQEGEKPLFTSPAEITPEQAAAQEFGSIVGQAMELPEGFQPPEVGPYTDLEAPKANIPIKLKPVVYESTEPGMYERVLGTFVSDKTQAALAQGVEAAGEKYVKPAYDWLTTSPKFVRDAVKEQEKKIDDILARPPAPAEEDVVVDPMLGITRSQALPSELSRETAKLVALKVGEAVSSPIDMASMAMGGVGPAVTAARRMGKVSSTLEKTVRGVDLGVQATAATPAVVEAVKAINEAVADPTAGNIAGATASTFLAAFAGSGAVNAFRASGTRISDRDYVVSDAQWKRAQNRMKAAQMTDEQFSAVMRRPLALPEGLPQIDTARTPAGEFIRTVIPSDGAVAPRPQPALPEFRAPMEEPSIATFLPSGETVLARPPLELPEFRAPVEELSMPTSIPSGETIQLPGPRVDRIMAAFSEDGIKLSREQATQLANITSPLEYSLMREAILDTVLPLPENVPAARELRKATSLKGFEEMIPVAAKKAAPATEVPVLEKAAPAPEPLVPLPVSPRRIELEPLIYDSGLVDEVGNPVFVNERGAPVDPRKYQDPREVVRTPKEQALYDQQISRLVELDRKSTALETVQQLPENTPVTVRLPEAEAPVPATFLGRVPDSAGFSRVATSEGQMVVPNVDITAAAAPAAKRKPVVKSRRPEVVRTKAPEVGTKTPEVSTKAPEVGTKQAALEAAEKEEYTAARLQIAAKEMLAKAKAGKTSKREIARLEKLTDEATNEFLVAGDKRIAAKQELEAAQLRAKQAKVGTKTPEVGTKPAKVRTDSIEVQDKAEQIQSRIEYLDELKATREITPEEHKTRVAEAKAELAAVKSAPPTITKVKDPTVGGWDVQLGPNKYRIFRDPEDRWWYLDGPGHHSRRVLSPGGTKADAIQNLTDKEAYWQDLIARENALIARGKRIRDAAMKKGMVSRVEDWADKTLKDYQGRVSANPFLDPKWVAANAVKGAFIMGRGATTFGRWSAGMLKELGEEIRPHLRKLWKYLHNEDVPGILAGRRRVKASEGTVKITPAELIQQAVGDAAENRRLFLAMRQGTGVAKNPEVTFTTKPDANGKTKPITVGATTGDGGKSYDAWMEETKAWMSPKEIADARLWYREANQMFRDIYGDDMPRELLLWLMSQQNVSPSGGIGNISNVKDMLAGIGLGKKGGLAHKKLMAVLSGEMAEGTAAGLSRKLLDFVDSGQLKNTRTFHGDDPAMGQPAVADVWSGRDSGHVDHQTLSRLYDMAENGNLYLDGEPVKLEVSEFKTIKEGAERRRVPLEMTYKTASMPEPVPLEVDLTSSPSGTQYEGVSKWMNDGARRMNLAEFAGITDWTPIEFQAVGWMRTLKQYGRAGQTVQEAFESNIRRIPAEVNYSSGSILPFEFPAWGDLDPAAQRKITTDVLNKLVPDLVKTVGGSLKLVNISEGQGRFAGEVSPMTSIEVLGSDAATTILRDALAYVTDQQTAMSWRAVVGGENKRAVIIKRADGQKLSDTDLNRITGEAKLEGYSVMRSPGDGNMILVTDADRNFTPRSFSAEKAKALTTRLEEWTKGNPDLPLDVRDVPSTIKSSTNDWNKSPNGEVYLQNIVRAGGGTRVSQLVGLRNRYAAEYLEPAFAEHSPQLLEQFRAERADAKGRWLPDALARRDFRDAIAAAAKKHPYGKAVTIKTAEEYAERGFKFYLAPDKSAGVGVTPDGDLVSVFKAKGSKVDIDPLLEQAAQRAIKLDAYDTGNGFLINKYGKLGFRPVARVAFNPDFAPKGWSYKRLGRPDIVYMVRDPDGVTGAPKVEGNYSEIRNQIPPLQFEDAVKRQAGAADEVRTDRSLGSDQRSAINFALLAALGQANANAATGFGYGYEQDQSASTVDRVINGFLWAALGIGAFNPRIRNAVLNGISRARIPVKWTVKVMGPEPQRLLGGMDNWHIFLRSGLQGVYDAIRGERMLAESLKDKPLKALEKLEAMRPGARPTLLSQLGITRGSTITPGDWTAVGDYLANGADPMLIRNKELRAQAKIVRSALDDFSRELVALGIARPGSDLHDTIYDNLGKYLTRTYKIFTDPTFEYDPANLVRASTEYATQLVLEGDTRPFSELVNEGHAQAAHQMAEVDGSAMVPARTFAQGGGIARVDGSILKPRKELSDAWAELLGVEKDPVRSAALTVDRMADMLAARATQLKMVEVGLELGIFSRRFSNEHSVPMIRKDPKAGNVPIYYPGSQRIPLLPNDVAKNPFEGIWVTPDARDAIFTLRSYQSHSLPLRMLSLATAGVKMGKTALHPISYVPNFASQVTQLLTQGHLAQAIFHPGIYRDAFSISFDRPFLSNSAKIRADVPMLIREGILKQDVNLNDLVATAEASGIAGASNRMVTWFPKTMAIPKALIKGALWTYGKVEEFPRLIGFYAEVDRYAYAMFGRPVDDLNSQELALVYRRAVDVTKRVYPNSQMVPEVVKKMSVIGSMDPFAAYKFSVYQTTVETGKIIRADLAEAVKTSNPRLRRAALARLAGLIGGLYGAYWLNDTLNKLSGVNDQQDKALRRRLPEWDRTGMLVVTSLTPEEAAYANQSYLLPQSMITAAIKAGLEGATPMQAGAAFIKETAGSMVSDGGLILKPVMEAVTGYNEYGRRIYPRDGGKYVDVSEIQADAVRNAATGGQNLVVGTMHVLKSIEPGFSSESLKWYKAANEEVGPDGQIYKVGDLTARLMGVRVQRINLPLQFERQAGELFSRINEARTEFGRARNRKDATPESIEKAYQLSEQSRKIVYRDLVQYLNDAQLLRQDRETTLRMLQKAGIPSDFLLGAINKIYVPGTKEKEVPAREQFEAMKRLPQAEQDAEWMRVQMTDPKLHKQYQALEREREAGITSEIRMLKNLDEDNGQRARMIAQLIIDAGDEQAQEQKAQEFRSYGLTKGETGRWLYDDPELKAKTWAEARALLETGKNPNYLPLPSAPSIEQPAAKPAQPRGSIEQPAPKPLQLPPQEDVFRDGQGRLWRQLPNGKYQKVTEPPPVPGKKTSFIEGKLYRDPTTGVMKVYRNGQFV